MGWTALGPLNYTSLPCSVFQWTTDIDASTAIPFVDYVPASGNSSVGVGPGCSSSGTFTVALLVRDCVFWGGFLVECWSVPLPLPLPLPLKHTYTSATDVYVVSSPLACPNRLPRFSLLPRLCQLSNTTFLAAEAPRVVISMTTTSNSLVVLPSYNCTTSLVLQRPHVTANLLVPAQLAPRGPNPALVVSLGFGPGPVPTTQTYSVNVTASTTPGSQALLAPFMSTVSWGADPTGTLALPVPDSVAIGTPADTQVCYRELNSCPSPLNILTFSIVGAVGLSPGPSSQACLQNPGSVVVVPVGAPRIDDVTSQVKYVPPFHSSPPVILPSLHTHTPTCIHARVRHS